MTYLEAINAVLRRTREDTVATYNATAYSTMVGDYVNDALDIVQNAWNWSQLIVELSLTTTASQQTLILDGLGELGQVYQILNDTSNHKIQQRTHGWMQDRTNLSSTTSGPPQSWAFNSQETDGDMTIDLMPIPDAIYNIRALVKKHQAAMSADGTVILVPHQPVIQQALAFVLEERGDSGGGNNMTQQARADRVLADYVALDQQRHPELLIWESV